MPPSGRAHRSTRPLAGRGGAALLAASILCAQPARADVTEAIRVQVTAPDGCPGTDAFIAEVTARTAKARIAAPGEQARSFKVTITTRGKRSRGTLIIEGPRGRGASRDVSGESCGEVASALALVTALAIDPQASTAAKLPPPPPKPPPPPPRPPPLPIVPLVPPREPRPPPPYTPSPWWGPFGEPLPAAPQAFSEARWRFGVLLHGGVASAIAPSIVPVVSGAVGLARVGSGVLSPSFRLSFLRADSGAANVGTGPQRARFRFSAGRLEGCPVRLEIVRRLSAHPCALFEAGVLDADGFTPFAPASAARPWAAPGVLGRVQIDIIGDVMLEIEGGAAFPLVRDTFYFAPSLTAHEIPAAGGFVGGGVGAHFP